MDKRLIETLSCPVSKTALRPASKAELDTLNAAITAGQVQTVAGMAVQERTPEALITTDGKVIYRVDDGIPVMLPEEGIGTAQFKDFPTAA
ncbi:Trm112 family protein [Dyella sp.]|uniref:Trm112 family protein n=1 Tax=Dyella sp. TaxID=1869338 RepID=UPI002ECFC1B4